MGHHLFHLAHSLGNLVRDPETRTTPSGRQVANYTIATNEGYKDASGNWQDKAEYHNIVAWERLAEVAANILQKGSQVYLEGKLVTRSWEDDNGNRRYRTEILCQSIIPLSRLREKDEHGGADVDAPAVPANVATQDNDDLPF